MIRGVSARIETVAVGHRRKLTLAGVTLLALLGFAALRLVLRHVHLSDVRAALHLVARPRLALSLALTAISYLALTGYDWTALRVIGRPLPWRTAAAASFTSYAISHNLGLSLLTGTSARHRVYSLAGLTLGDVARITGIVGFTFWAGIGGISALSLLASPSIVLPGLVLSANESRVLGAAILVIVSIPLAARLTGRKRLAIGRCTLAVPTVAQQGQLLAAALVDMLAASAALFVLMPAPSIGAFPEFFVLYALAVAAGLVAHVPGGIGVFEAIVLGAMPGDRPAVFAALLLYRLIYYLLPLLVAGVGIAIIEAWRHRQPAGRGLSVVQRGARALAPGAISLLLFLGGLVLLVSGALPGVKGRLSTLEALLPLPFIEASHLAASLVGTAMLLTAPTLNARLRSGFMLARALLIGGIVFSLMKGLDWEEALLQLVILTALQSCSADFDRRGGILAGPPQWGWIGAALAAVALSLWAGFFAYKRTPYSGDLWWHFALHGNAPRFLRASFGAGVLLAATALWQLINRRGSPPAITTLPPDVAAAALAKTSRTDANLAFTGDKSFVVSASGDAFLMYHVRNRTWVVMGDPVGPHAAWNELVWTARRLCHAAGGRLCFYQASEALLPLFVDLGLVPIKYGEEAHVPLNGLALNGPWAKDFRHALRRCDAAGITFAIEPSSAVPALLPELRHVSDSWLAERGGREKRFSLGAFDPAYLARCDVIVARRQTAIIAFANIWKTGEKTELSIDIMRHVSDAPGGVMDALIVRLMEWGRDEGYHRFNLGMAPLSGMPSGPLAPAWAKLAHALFDHGERLYGFAGLRAWKEKFRPEWVPRFVATPPGAARLYCLLDLVRLINRGGAPGPARVTADKQDSSAEMPVRSAPLPPTPSL
ncbi:MAG: bifunctional lysylphosphatidylglycerol flippase/synthetase MprF [Sphingomonas sp.]